MKPLHYVLIGEALLVLALLYQGRGQSTATAPLRLPSGAERLRDPAVARRTGPRGTIGAVDREFIPGAGLY